MATAIKPNRLDYKILIAFQLMYVFCKEMVTCMFTRVGNGFSDLGRGSRSGLKPRGSDQVILTGYYYDRDT
jgi:hypothetical protein